MASNSADLMIPLIGRRILLNLPSEARQRSSLTISMTALRENSRSCKRKSAGSRRPKMRSLR